MAAPTYPLTLPSAPGFTDANWKLVRKVAVGESPFTGAQQTHEYDYALWSATLALPPMKRPQAAEWAAFMLKLHGRRGTFTLGDPDAKAPRGSISGSVTLGANISIGDYTITLTTASASTAGLFKAGDYIQIGSGATAKLHMIVDDAGTSDGSGDVDVNIEPAIKVAATAGDSVVYTNPVGVFRMETNELGWDADSVSKYGITFACKEAI